MKKNNVITDKDSSYEDYKSIRSMEETPDQRAWLKLERKLSQKHNKSQIFIYQNIAIAAAILFLLTFALLIGNSLGDNDYLNTQKVISENNLEPYSIQDLDYDSDPIYSALKIQELHISYSRNSPIIEFKNDEIKKIL